MTLVEKAVLDRLRTKQLTQSIQQPELRNLVEIQAHIENLLTNSKLSDDEKVTLLQAAQNRFKKFKEGLYSHVSETTPEETLTAPAPDVGPPAPVAAPTHTPSKTYSKLFGTVNLPKMFQNKFGALKNFLEDRPDLVRKNEKNEMVLEGKPIDGSNFDDLIRNLYIKNQRYNLEGNKEFLSTLRKSNMSPSFISNKLVFSIFSPENPSPPHHRSTASRGSKRLKTSSAPTSTSATTSTSAPPKESGWPLFNMTNPFARYATTSHKKESKRGGEGEDYLSGDEGDPENQSGKGKRHPPPGKQPRILKLYH